MFPGKGFYKIINAPQTHNCLNKTQGNTENYIEHI